MCTKLSLIFVFILTDACSVTAYSQVVKHLSKSVCIKYFYYAVHLLKDTSLTSKKGWRKFSNLFFKLFQVNTESKWTITTLCPTTGQTPLHLSLTKKDLTTRRNGNVFCDILIHPSAQQFQLNHPQRHLHQLTPPRLNHINLIPLSFKIQLRVWTICLILMLTLMVALAEPSSLMFQFRKVQVTWSRTGTRPHKLKTRRDTGTLCSWRSMDAVALGFKSFHITHILN